MLTCETVLQGQFWDSAEDEVADQQDEERHHPRGHSGQVPASDSVASQFHVLFPPDMTLLHLSPEPVSEGCRETRVWGDVCLVVESVVRQAAQTGRVLGRVVTHHVQVAVERDGAAAVHRDEGQLGGAVDDSGEGLGHGGGGVGEVNVGRVESDDGSLCQSRHLSVASPVVPVEAEHRLSRPARSHAHQPPGQHQLHTLLPAGGGAAHHLGYGLEARDEEEVPVDHTVDQLAGVEVEPGDGVDVVGRDGSVMVDQESSALSSQQVQPGTGYPPAVEELRLAENDPGHWPSEEGHHQGRRVGEEAEWGVVRKEVSLT